MPSNNPNSGKHEARLVKHPGKRDRMVVATPPKSKLQLTVKVYEPCVTIRCGVDGIYRVWDVNGHLVGWGTKEDVEKLI